MTIFSLNEVEVMAKRATRGAGYEWGIAEEAGKAIRWLCSFDLNGCEALAQLLKSVEHSSFLDMRPTKMDGVWTSNSGVMCPLLAGSTLSDFAFKLKENPVSMGKTLQPKILIPFVAAGAYQLQSVVTLSWGNLIIVTNGDDVCVSGDHEGLSPLHIDNITLSLSGHTSQNLPLSSRIEVPKDTWDTLNMFAHQVYAPATEESRLLGAGEPIEN